MSGARLIGDVTWEQLARDRRAHRLRRGRHFQGDIRALEKMARGAAAEAGLAVRTVRDEFIKTGYLWVQFFDGELMLGEPCPACGGEDLVRTHELFGRCQTCGARLSFHLPPPVTSVGPSAPATAGTDAGAAVGSEGQGTMHLQEEKLRRKQERLRRRRVSEFGVTRMVQDVDQSDETQEVWYGIAEVDGTQALLWATYPLDAGDRVPHPDFPDEDLHYVAVIGLDPYRRARALGLLSD